MHFARPIRFSLSNILLVFTIVALASAFWWATQQHDLLQLRIVQLERDNISLRNMSGLLTITDLSKVHVIETSHRYFDIGTYPQNQERRWTVWIPDGCSFELHFATGNQASGLFPKSSPKGPIILGSGEHHVRVTAMTSPQNDFWHLQLATDKEKRAMNAKWLRWKDPLVNYSGAGTKTELFDETKPILIWHLNIEERTSQALDGLMIWLSSSATQP